jgi:hypothetical protein
MSGLIPPVSAHSSVEIDNSCNDCCGCLGRRRIRPKPIAHHKPISKPTMVGGDINGGALNDAALKAHAVSMPTLTESGQWQVEIDGVKHIVK